MSERDYSHRTLVQKLGIEKAERALFLNAPNGYDDALGEHFDKEAGPYDFIQLFATSLSELNDGLPSLKQQMVAKGMLWVSWPKRGRGIKNDLNENLIRGIGLQNGLVDVKVISVNDQWSGLKFVFRLKDRYLVSSIMV